MGLGYKAACWAAALTPAAAEWGAPGGGGAPEANWRTSGLADMAPGRARGSPTLSLQYQHGSAPKCVLAGRGRPESTQWRPFLLLFHRRTDLGEVDRGLCLGRLRSFSGPRWLPLCVCACCARTPSHSTLQACSPLVLLSSLAAFLREIRSPPSPPPPPPTPPSLPAKESSGAWASPPSAETNAVLGEGDPRARARVRARAAAVLVVGE